MIDIGSIVASQAAAFLVNKLINSVCGDKSPSLSSDNLLKFIIMLQQTTVHEVEKVFDHGAEKNKLHMIATLLHSTTNKFKQYCEFPTKENLHSAEQAVLDVYSAINVLVVYENLADRPETNINIWSRNVDAPVLSLKYVALHLLQGICAIDLIISAISMPDDNIPTFMKQRAFEYHSMIVRLINSIIYNACQDYSSQLSLQKYIDKMNLDPIRELLDDTLNTHICKGEAPSKIHECVDGITNNLFKQNFSPYLEYLYNTGAKPRPNPKAIRRIDLSIGYTLPASEGRSVVLVGSEVRMIVANRPKMQP